MARQGVRHCNILAIACIVAYEEGKFLPPVAPVSGESPLTEREQSRGVLTYSMRYCQNYSELHCRPANTCCLESADPLVQKKSQLRHSKIVYT